MDCLGATLDFIGRPETGSRGTQGLLKARGGNARGSILVKRFYFNRLVLQRYASVILFHCASLKFAIKPRESTKDTCRVVESFLVPTCRSSGVAKANHILVDCSALTRYKNPAV